LRPHVEAWDRDATLDPAVLQALAELGFFGMLAPESAGGMDFGVPAYAAALEALGWGEPTVALVLAMHTAFGVRPLLEHGTDEQKAEWLPALAAGDRIACLALSEPGAGTDLTAMHTRAERDGDGWLLNGAKQWVSAAGLANLALVVARTAPAGEAGHGAVGVFIVPLETAGVAVGERKETLGLRPLPFADVRFDGVRLPAAAALGDVTGGAEEIHEGTSLARLGIAAQAVGIATAALDHAVAYAGQREQFGSRLREFEGVQYKLADMATRTEAARSLLMDAASRLDTHMAAMAKLFASEVAMWCATQAVQVFGGYGYMRDYPVEKLMRDAKATEIYESTNEMQRVAIARELYRRD
jgi:alkylation response protein AidB-like acyl-CoA dehydrogenase